MENNRKETLYLAAGIHVKVSIYAGKPLGNCFEDVTKFMGADKVARFYTEVTGKDCGCKGRQKLMNNLVPNLR